MRDDLRPFYQRAVDDSYMDDLGVLRWSRDKENGSKKGDRVGSYDNKGYQRTTISINGKQKLVRAHLVEWFRHHNKLPEPPHQIDHIVPDKKNNHISNLRCATHGQNQGNCGKISRKCSSIYKGVTFRKDNKKWEAVCAGKKRGCYLSEELAALAYNEAALEHFGEFALLNKIK